MLSMETCLSIYVLYPPLFQDSCSFGDELLLLSFSFVPINGVDRVVELFAYILFDGYPAVGHDLFHLLSAGIELFEEAIDYFPYNIVEVLNGKWQQGNTLLWVLECLFKVLDLLG